MTRSISQFALDSATELYLGFFGRAPDAAGLYYWSTQISAGASPLDVANGFARSQEFVQNYGSLSAAGQVRLAYENILERSPDAGGLAYWTGRLQSGTSIGEIVWSLVHSAFTQEGTADALLVQGKVAAAQELMSPVILDIAQSTWNINSGYGVINVASALSSVLGISIQEGASFQTSIEQWPIPVTQFSDAWAAGYTGKGVVVAVIDTGLDLDNAALTHNISSLSWNFVANNQDVQDDNGHGTAVASQIISRAVEGQSNALMGAAYDAELMVLKAMDATGNGSRDNLIEAIYYAVDNGADVINLSLGGGPRSSEIFAALNYAAKNNVIVCMAAGNMGATAPQYPAAYVQGINSAIAVGSVMQNTNGDIVWASSSNAAGTVQPYNYISAPGSEVLAYGLDNVVQSWSGTSFATPYISAAVANLLSANTGLGAEQIVNALVNTSIDLIGFQPSLA
ncbi:S8 family serine peptidase [Polynucleobacter sp. 31A-FELB]|uniref:S8 family serine peptidase n=1 Tax=Polynucleobacter sp. 31A-FELB TaxID=2689096 RepID=UPI001C0D101C|nr:S8 family serine peptidase [Polynucleobacter sp. 31A-FELB]